MAAREMGDDVARPSVDRVIEPQGRYQPSLDGLRSIAVYLVVLFHAGVGGFTGGYIGVDVFFVLSGFLVTRLLLRDLDGGGAVRFGRFYARRFRRLLPAAFVALVGTAMVFVVLDPIEAMRAEGSFRAAFLYVANWYFIRESAAYFGGGVSADPVLQFWSLAVEEQFYLVWPVVLAGVVGLARRLVPTRSTVAVRVVVAVGAAASLGWALHLRTSDLDRAYFGTDARAYQLLVGASIALVPAAVARAGRWRTGYRVAAPVALVGIVAVASSVGGGDAIVRGVAATVATAVVLVALEREGGGLASRLLSLPPFVYLGKVSYGTYLWHWPIILVLGLVLDIGPWATAIAAAVGATALASLSFQMIEHPVRISSALDRHRFVVIGAGLTVSVVAALVLVPKMVVPDGVLVSRPAAAQGSGTPVPDWFDYVAVYGAGYGPPLDEHGAPLTCLDDEPDRCTVVRGNGPHVLLMGDSTAQALTGGFVAAAEANDFTLSVLVATGCPWQRGWYEWADALRERCKEVKEDGYQRVIPALDPDVIVVSSKGARDDRGPSDPSHGSPNPELTRATLDSLQELAVGGRTVVVAEPFPAPPDEMDPLACLAGASAIEECRFLAGSDPSWYETTTRQAADGNGRILSADLDRLACPYFPICDPIIGNQVVTIDGVHLTAAYSRSLAGPIAAYLRGHGLIP